MYNLEEVIRFELDERKVFFDTYFPFEEVENFFDDLTKEEYQILRQKTLAGIQEGVQRFLDKWQPRPAALYFADLPEFHWDGSIEAAIKKELLDTRFAQQKYFDDYCSEIGGGYPSYTYNDGLRHFDERFHLHNLRQFERQELDKFFSHYLTGKELREYFPALPEKVYPVILAATKEAIQEGISEHLRQFPGIKTVYHSDLCRFAEKNVVGTYLRRNISLIVPQGHEEYCTEVAWKFAIFLHDYSRLTFHSHSLWDQEEAALEKVVKLKEEEDRTV